MSEDNSPGFYHMSNKTKRMKKKFNQMSRGPSVRNKIGKSLRRHLKKNHGLSAK